MESAVGWAGGNLCPLRYYQYVFLWQAYNQFLCYPAAADGAPARVEPGALLGRLSERLLTLDQALGHASAGIAGRIQAEHKEHVAGLDRGTLGQRPTQHGGGLSRGGPAAMLRPCN